MLHFNLSNHSQVDCGLHDHFAITIGVLWDFGGLSVAFYKRVSIIMLQKSSARKGFCAEDWRIKEEIWYIKHAEVAML